jgi:hypothetical protein
MGLERLPIIRHIRGEMRKRSEIRSAAQTLVRLQIDEYIQKHLFGNPRYEDPKRLARYEYTVFSQFGEDGAMAEIFRRIGEGSRRFVEIGAGDGLENNTTYLLTRKWSGAWIEAGARNAASIRDRFAEQFASGQLKLAQTFISAENVEASLAGLGVAGDFDLLSLDIDLNTYWVWQAITVRPRVVAIEYNAVYPPGDHWIARYQADRSWDGSSHMGASLSALEALGRDKGYSLVGCSFAGANAFFVRDDLLADLFCAPYTAANHHEPPRYFLYTSAGHRRGWGPPA